MRRLMLARSVPTRCYAGGPVDDEWRGNATFVREVLVAPERRVGERGPALAEKDGRLRAARALADEDAARARFGVSAVVRHDEDCRVVEHAALFQTGDQV